LGGVAEGSLSTSISPEGSAVADGVSTMNASGVGGPRGNAAVYIRPWGSLGRAIPGSGWFAGRVRIKISA